MTLAYYKMKMKISEQRTLGVMARALGFGEQKRNPPNARSDRGRYENIDCITEIRGTPKELDSDMGMFGDAKVNGVLRNFFLLPKLKGTPETRRKVIVKLTSFLYKLEGDSDEEVGAVILQSLLAARDSVKEGGHWGGILTRAVENVPLYPGDPGYRRLVSLADKQSGPRLPQLTSVLHTHTAEDTMRLLRYYGLSDDKARHLRCSAVLGLATEYAVKKLERELDGCQSPRGFVETESISFTRLAGSFTCVIQLNCSTEILYKLS